MIAAPPAPTVAAGSASAAYCPARAPQSLPRPDSPAAQTQLAPGGASGAVVCRYAGLNSRPRLGLTASALVRDRATVDRITWGLDSLPTGPAGPVACPNDDGSELFVRLGYPDGSVVPVTLELSGCSAVTNGAVRRTASGLPGSPGLPLLRLLTRLARAIG